MSQYRAGLPGTEEGWKMKSLVVRDYMTESVISLDPDLEISSAIQMLIEHDISGAPILDEHGCLVGILTERDCISVAVHAGFEQNPYGLVRDYMARNPESVTPDQSILTVAEKFIHGQFHRYPVVDNGRLVGVISRRDVMRAMGMSGK
jgi:CBS domain-containing protein